MPVGAGKYDDIATMVRKATQAEGVVIIIMNGDKGGGFSVQGTLRVIHDLPELLESTARQIREAGGST